MKKVLVSMVGILLFSVSVFAQEVVADEEKSSIFFDGSSYHFIFQWGKGENFSGISTNRTSSNKLSSHWTGAGFAFSRLENPGNISPAPNLNLSRSYSVVLNLMDYNIPLSKHWVIASGLGFDWSRYHFRGNIGLQEVGGISQFVKDQQWEYESNKLLIYYATIPLLLEYQTAIGRNKHFFIYGGVEGLVKCYSKSQLDMQTLNGIQKVNHHDLNLLPLNFRVTCRAGFDDFSVFGYYQPYSLFEKDKGPEMYSRGIGLMLNF
jgi:hypothetical protein